MTITYFSEKPSKNEQHDEIYFGKRMKNAIEVEFIDTNLYKSKELWLPYGSRGAYGGQVIAQSLRAAWYTVNPDFFVHSIHCYFILACDITIPILFNVLPVRDGKSFATRIVKATQRGKVVFTSSCSFTKIDESSIELNHQSDMPKVPEPETLLSNVDLLEKAMEAHIDKISEKFKNRQITKIKDSFPVDFRQTNELTIQEVVSGIIKPSRHSPKWFKTTGVLDDDLRVHACVLAYASDTGLVTTAAQAHGYSLNAESIGMVASLDHSMWFHVPTRVDEWLLYDVHSPRTFGGRGIAFGRIYNRQGVLVATTAQEGIVRLSSVEQERRQENQSSPKL